MPPAHEQGAGGANGCLEGRCSQSIWFPRMWWEFGWRYICFEPDPKRTHWNADMARATSGRSTPRMGCIYPDVVSRCFRSGRTGLDWRSGELRERPVFEVFGAEVLEGSNQGRQVLVARVRVGDRCGARSPGGAPPYRDTPSGRPQRAARCSGPTCQAGSRSASGPRSVGSATTVRFLAGATRPQTCGAMEQKLHASPMQGADPVAGFPSVATVALLDRPMSPIHPSELENAD